MKAPAIPSNVVMMNPLGSRPGVMSFATRPARKPMMMVQRMCMTLALAPYFGISFAVPYRRSPRHRSRTNRRAIGDPSLLLHEGYGLLVSVDRVVDGVAGTLSARADRLARSMCAVG